MEVGWLSKGESRQDGRVVGVCLVSGEAEAVRGAALEVVMRQRLEVGGARPHWPPPPPPSSLSSSSTDPILPPPEICFFGGELLRAHLGEVINGREETELDDECWFTSRRKSKSPLWQKIKNIS